MRVPLSLLGVAATTLAANHAFYPRWDNQNSTITPPAWPTAPPPTETITCTTETTIDYCPKSTSCHGQTVTQTGTSGPLPCAPTITCTCVLPTAPPVLPTCPPGLTCTGQTMTIPNTTMSWTNTVLSTTGTSTTEVIVPTGCAGTCTVELPSTTEGGNVGPIPSTSSNPALANGANREKGGAEMIAAFFAAGAAFLF